MKNIKLVLSGTEVKKNGTYQIGQLPPGIIFNWGKGNFRTILHPQFNLVANNHVTEVLSDQTNMVFQFPALTEVKVIHIIK